MYRPVILIGNGARGNPALVSHLCSLGVPMLTTWQGVDLVPEDSQVFCGRPGVFGQRAANIIQQKATHLYVVGARLDGEQVAYDYSRFAPGAIKIVYDIDAAELGKLPAIWHKVCDDLTDPPAMSIERGGDAWLAWCRALYARFRPELDGGQVDNGYIDTFAFIHRLSEVTHKKDLLALGSSSGAVNSFLQAYRVKAGQRVTVCASIGAMGADIPMAAGATLAGLYQRTICITGDGGFQLNTQELETIRRLSLPIVFFVFNNGGYNSIRVMQRARFDGRIVGADAQSGFTLPPLIKLAEAYGFSYWRMTHSMDLRLMERLIASPVPRIIEVMVDPDWVQLPRVMASTVDGQLRTDDMQDMTPKLDPVELQALMEWDG